MHRVSRSDAAPRGAGCSQRATLVDQAGREAAHGDSASHGGSPYNGPIRASGALAASVARGRDRDA